MNAGDNYNRPKVLQLIFWLQKDWDDLKINAASIYSNIENGPKIFGYMLENLIF